MTGLLIERAPERLPSRTFLDGVLQCGVAAAIHVAALAAIAIWLTPAMARRSVNTVTPAPAVLVEEIPLPRIVFLAPAATAGGGGGGGGNRNPAPIRRATGVGHDAATLRTRQRPIPPETPGFDVVERPPEVLLEARSLASGDSVQSGLPIGGVPVGTSLGPGSGGGVGTGRGTGIGSGEGPGIGPGSGGGIGGGVYKIGNGVTAPRLVTQTTPRYTADALQRKVQGAVRLEAVVTRGGRATLIRVSRSLEPGLDAEAIAALEQWRFSPGLLGGSPVDVEVLIVMEFWIR